MELPEEKRFKDLLPGDTFRILSQGVFVKTECGRACRLKDGSIHEIHYNKKVDRLGVVSAEFRLARVDGRYVLVCPLPDKRRCIVLEFVVIDSDFIRNEEIEFAETRDEVIEKRRQVTMLIHELEGLSKDTQIILTAVKSLMSTNGKFGKILCQPEDPEMLKFANLWEKVAFQDD